MATREKKTGLVETKEYSLNDYLEKNYTSFNEEEKEEEWLDIGQPFRDITGLKGIPKGQTTIVRGFSNTGKSTMLYQTAVACQKVNILPVIINTENSLSKTHLELMGFDYNKPHMIVDNDFLLDNFGYKRNKDIYDASIEDVAEFVNDMLNKQRIGDLKTELFFFWDSVGSIDCLQSLKAYEKDAQSNNMWNANALEKSFKSILNNRIPASKKKKYEYTNSFMVVQKIWLDNMQGSGVVKHKGGEAFYYGSRLIMHFGGIQSHSTRLVTAIKGGQEITFGIETKLDVKKNHVNGISYSDGKIISTPHGFIAATKDALDEYKKEHLSYFKEMLGGDGDFELKMKELSLKEKMALEMAQ